MNKSINFFTAKWWSSKLNERLSAEAVFYFGFIPLIWILLWKTTSFPQVPYIEALAMALFTACVALKFSVFDHFSIREVIFFLICLVIAVMSYFFSGFTRPLVIVIVVWGAKDLDAKKILKVWLLLSILNLILTMSAARIGIIEDYSFSWNEKGALADTVYSFGITNTTDCAARIFYTVLVWFYLRGYKLRWFEYIGGFLIAFGTYYYTGGRIDTGCIVIMTVMFLIVNILQSFLEKRRKVVKENSSLEEYIGTSIQNEILPALALLSLPLAATVALSLCSLYSPNAIWTKIDRWTSGRLSVGHYIFNNYDIRLFGEPIDMIGNGRGESYRILEGAQYNFIDISYQSVLMLYGVVFFALVVFLYLYLVWNRKKDTYLMLCVILIAVNCMFAHHLTELSYIPFTILALCKADREQIVRSPKMRYVSVIAREKKAGGLYA